VRCGTGDSDSTDADIDTAGGDISTGVGRVGQSSGGRRRAVVRRCTHDWGLRSRTPDRQHAAADHRSPAASVCSCGDASHTPARAARTPSVSVF
jgi:hypothetical protein